MAIATESGYGAFLPKYKNDFVDREALRGQMVKQASYLSSMDQVYAQLDEQARQFDDTMTQRESEFGRKLKYEYDALEQSSEQFDSKLRLDWYGAKTQRKSVTNAAKNQQKQLRLQQQQLQAQQEQFSSELAWQQEQFGQEMDWRQTELSTNQQIADQMYDVYSQAGTTSSDNSDIMSLWSNLYG